jgi:hypothetical protein
VGREKPARVSERVRCFLALPMLPTCACGACGVHTLARALLARLRC